MSLPHDDSEPRDPSAELDNEPITDTGTDSAAALFEYDEGADETPVSTDVAPVAEASDSADTTDAVEAADSEVNDSAADDDLDEDVSFDAAEAESVADDDAVADVTGDEASEAEPEDDETELPEADATASESDAAASEVADDGDEVPATEPTAATFDDLGLSPALLANLAALGYEEPTPIQTAAIVPQLAGRDLLGQAATGTGKTAAFALPMLQHLSAQTERGVPRGLILVPTRELAIQVSQAIHRYAHGLDLEVLPLFGGQPIGRQLSALRRGVDVVVATPGRAVDHLDRATLDLSQVSTLVLDEADEMLDMGFADELDAIVAATPSERQTVFFSATVPARISRLAGRYLRDAEVIRVGGAEDEAPAVANVSQRAFVVHRNHKVAALGRLLDAETPAATIVFCRTRLDVDRVAEAMAARGYRAEALHGGLAQEQRERILQRMRSGSAELVVATDVAARGLDIDVLTHVVCFDVPSSPDVYVHRIGRVGRAGRTGAAVCLVEPREHRLLRNIERHVGSRLVIEKLPTPEHVQSQRLGALVERIRDAIASGTEDLFSDLVDDLAVDGDSAAVAAAAIAVAHEALGGSDDQENIPDAELPGSRSKRDRGESGPRGRDGRDRDGRGDRGDRGFDRGSRGGDDGPAPGRARLHVNGGRFIGLRPGDLVGAIANEAGLAGSDIGPIRIFDRFSVVDVPADAVDRVVAAVGDTNVRGKAVRIRPDNRHGSGDGGSGGGRSGGGWSRGGDGDRRPPRRDDDRRPPRRDDDRPRGRSGDRDGRSDWGRGRDNDRSFRGDGDRDSRSAPPRRKDRDWSLNGRPGGRRERTDGGSWDRNDRDRDSGSRPPRSDRWDRPSGDRRPSSDRWDRPSGDRRGSSDRWDSGGPRRDRDDRPSGRWDGGGPRRDRDDRPSGRWDGGDRDRPRRGPGRPGGRGPARKGPGPKRGPGGGSAGPNRRPPRD